MFITLLLGWWGIAFGLIVTPVQLLRNIAAAATAKSPTSEPSPDLCAFARGILAQSMIENHSEQVLP